MKRLILELSLHHGGQEYGGFRERLHLDGITLDISEGGVCRIADANYWAKMKTSSS